MKKIDKIFYALCILIMIAGILVVKVKGVNYSNEYKKGKNIEIYFDNAIEKSDIEQISKEIFGQDAQVFEIERFRDAVIIRTNDVSDEQKTNLINKLNEKYSIELSTEEDVKISDVPKISGYDLISQYIKPTIISGGIIFVYLAIRYRKHGHVIAAIVTISKAILITGAYFGIVVLTRQPIVNMFTIPIGLFVATISLFIICYRNENQLEIQNEKENN